MEKQVKELKEIMESLQRNKEAYTKKLIIFGSHTVLLTEAIKRDKDKIESLKAEIDPLAVQIFKDTGKKKLFGGIGIQERSPISYDSKKALDFAKEKKMFLQLDTKAFNKVAASLDLDFVTTNKTTLATFPKEIKL